MENRVARFVVIVSVQFWEYSAEFSLQSSKKMIPVMLSSCCVQVVSERKRKKETEGKREKKRKKRERESTIFGFAGHLKSGQVLCWTPYLCAPNRG